MSFETFKLDAAAIHDPYSPHQKIVVYQYNIPVDRTETPATFETIRQHLEQDFPVEDQARVIVPLYFQISAVFILVHRDSGEERIWLGSFNPRSRELGQITQYRPFDSATFAPYALAHCRPQFVLNELLDRSEGQESVWMVDRLLSVILSAQATVRTSHIVFHRHPQLLGAPNGAGQAQGSFRRRSVFRIQFD